jgi:hypothetical protein
MAFTYRKTVKALNNSMELIAKSLKSRLEENFADASGDLGKSITVSAKKSNNLLEVNISMLDYWEALDKGRKPGKQPPINKIKEWLTYPNPRAKLGLEGVSNVNIAEVNSLAFLIARKIGKKGTKGNNFASDVFDSKKVTVDLPNAIADAVFEDLNIVLDDLVTSIN